MSRAIQIAITTKILLEEKKTIKLKTNNFLFQISHTRNINYQILRTNAVVIIL